MSSLVKTVKDVTYAPDRIGFIRAVSRQESGSDLRYSYTYIGKNKEGIKVDNPNAVRILNPWSYVGLFQFSEIALEDVGCYIKDGTRDGTYQDWGDKKKKYWTNKYGASSFDVFRNSGEIQMKAIQYWIDRLCGYMRNINANEFYGKTITGAKDLGSFEVTESGVITARHLKGDNAVKDFLTSNGRINDVDGNGTSVGKYMSLFAHYDLQSCCKRKIYVKIVDVKKIGIPNKEVEISSEYKGTFNLGKIIVTHKTDKEGYLPVIVRHPKAKIQLKIGSTVVETIIQKADQIQRYEIVYLGKNNYSSVLSEHKKVNTTQGSNDSNSSTNNDKTTSSDQQHKTTNNIIDEVTFNIKLVEGDTGKPLPNTTYHLEYKNNIKPHKTDSSGIESGIKAEVSQSIGVYLDDDGGKKQSIYSMAFPVTGDLNGQTKVLKVPVVAFSIKFVDNNNQPIPHYEFKTLYRGRQSAMKRANSQGISTIKALAGQKLTVIDGQGRAQTTAIVTYGSKQWTMIIGTDITREDISNVSDAVSQEAPATSQTSKQENTLEPQTEQEPVIKVEKPKVKEVEKKTEDGPTVEVSSDEARITIKFVDESTNKPLSGLSYWTQSDKYGKNPSVTGSDGTRGRTHDSLVGVDITVLAYEDGKEVKKDVITADVGRNDIPYIYKAKKPEFEQGIITYNIYENNQIIKYIPKSIFSSNKQKYKYIYYEKNGRKHHICTVNWNKTKEKSKGKLLYSKPTHSGIIYDKNVSEGSTKRRVKYKNEDIAEYGNHPTLGKIWRLYTAGNTEIVLVKMPDSLNFSASSIKIAYNFSATQRRYTSPGHLSCFIGALAKVGTRITTTGSCFKEGSSFPSTAHNNGKSIDTIYLNSRNMQQTFITAMHNFGCNRQLRGRNTYRYKHTGDGGTLHNSHLHSEFDESKVKIIYE